MSAPRFLVDENLSVLLPEVAHARGYEATHINHYGLRNPSIILRVLQTSNGLRGPLEQTARALIRSHSLLHPHARSWEHDAYTEQES